MQITIISIGSRGDIQPYIALSKGLNEAGHSVRLATHTAFAPLIRSYEAEFFPLDDDPREFFQTEKGQRLLEGGSNAFRFVHRLSQMIAPLVNMYMERCEQACQDADVIIVTYLSFFIGYTTAEKLKKPLVVTFLQPSLLTTRYLPEPSSFLLPQWPPLLGETLNLISHAAARRIFGQLFTPAVNEARQKMYHLPPFPKKSLFAALPEHVQLILFGYSPLLVPKPQDWGESTHVTGFWTLDHPKAWQPEPELVRFLRAGPPPVYIGFGSMSSGRPAETLDLVCEALALARQRGVVLIEKGFVPDQRFSEQIYITTGVPHDWLFPQMSAIVHHGGAGSTAASLNAGVPTIVVPYLSDQCFWGYRIAALGTGPKPLSRDRLAVRRLAETLTSVLENQAMRQRAVEVGTQLRAEHGVTRAVEAFNKYFANR